MDAMILLVGIWIRRERGITQYAEAVVANVELRGAAGHGPGGRTRSPLAGGAFGFTQPLFMRHFGRS